MEAGQKTDTNGALVSFLLIVTKWKPLVLRHLIEGPKRTGEGISSKVLTDQLRRLECDGIIIRNVFNDVAPPADYSSSEGGKSLVSIFGRLSVRGEELIECLDNHGETITLDCLNHEK